MKVFLESKSLLQTVAAEAEKNNEAAKLLVAGLTEEQLNWKPASDRWSIAQCLDHLAVTSAQFNKLFTAAIERGGTKWPVNGPVPYRPSLVGGWLIKQVLPETTRKFPAPKVFRPSDSSDIQGALEKYLNQQASFIRFVNDSANLDYNKTRLRSPVTPLMRYSLADAYVVTVVHGWRHLAQARRVREAPEFPTN